MFSLTIGEEGGGFNSRPCGCDYSLQIAYSKVLEIQNFSEEPQMGGTAFDENSPIHRA
jgi:hypothetical protein